MCWHWRGYVQSAMESGMFWIKEVSPYKETASTHIQSCNLFLNTTTCSSTICYNCISRLHAWNLYVCKIRVVTEVHVSIAMCSWRLWYGKCKQLNVKRHSKWWLTFCGVRWCWNLKSLSCTAGKCATFRETPHILCSMKSSSSSFVLLVRKLQQAK
jgi:hypothetical protein